MMRDVTERKEGITHSKTRGEGTRGEKAQADERQNRQILLLE